MDLREIAEFLGVKHPQNIVRSLIDKGLAVSEDELKERYKSLKKTYVSISKEVLEEEEVLRAELDRVETRAPAQARALLAYLDLAPKGEAVLKTKLQKQADVNSSVIKKWVERDVFVLEEREVDLLLLRVERLVGVARQDREEQPDHRQEVLHELRLVCHKHTERPAVEQRADEQREVVVVEQPEDGGDYRGQRHAHERREHLLRPRPQARTLPAIEVGAKRLEPRWNILGRAHLHHRRRGPASGGRERTEPHDQRRHARAGEQHEQEGAATHGIRR